MALTATIVHARSWFISKVRPDLDKVLVEVKRKGPPRKGEKEMPKEDGMIVLSR